MSEDTTGKIIVEEPYKSPALHPLEAGLDFGFLTRHSTSEFGLFITNPDDRPVEWRIQIGTEKPGMGVRERLEDSARPAGEKENFSIANAKGVILSETKGQLQAHKSHTVYVTVNTANLQSGYAYTTNLTLISQAAGTPTTSVIVPLTFYVSSAPQNDSGPRAPTDQPPSINFTIQGSYPLSFTNNPDNDEEVHWKLVPDSGGTWLDPDPSEGTFKPNEQAIVQLTARRVAGLSGRPHTNLNLHLTWVDRSRRGKKTDVMPWIPVDLTVQ